MVRLKVEDLEFIPASEVPSHRDTRWDEIFKTIPPGQAFVINGKGRVICMLQALRRRHKQGRFEGLTGFLRGNKGYTVNEEVK